MSTDGRREIAHVGPIERYTPMPVQSRDFFVHDLGEVCLLTDPGAPVLPVIA